MVVVVVVVVVVAEYHRTLADTYFLTRVGEKTELAWVAGYISRWFAF